MQFRTQIPIPTSTHPIDYYSKIISLGSCFCDQYIRKLIILNFRMPVIHLVFCFIRLQLKNYCLRCRKKIFTEVDIFYNERWHCYDAHSDLSNGDPIELLNDLNTIIKSTRNN
jgi:hypothetical protein